MENPTGRPSTDGLSDKKDNNRRRRSSMRKSRSGDNVTNTSQEERPMARRVSFASSNKVKQFATDSDVATLWDNTYEENMLEPSSDHSSAKSLQKLATSSYIHPKNIPADLPIDKENIPVDPMKLVEFIKEQKGAVLVETVEQTNVLEEDMELTCTQDSTQQNLLTTPEINSAEARTNLEKTKLDLDDMEFTCVLPQALRPITKIVETNLLATETETVSFTALPDDLQSTRMQQGATFVKDEPKFTAQSIQVSKEREKSTIENDKQKISFTEEQFVKFTCHTSIIDEPKTTIVMLEEIKQEATLMEEQIMEFKCEMPIINGLKEDTDYKMRSPKKESNSQDPIVKCDKIKAEQAECGATFIKKESEIVNSDVLHETSNSTTNVLLNPEDVKEELAEISQTDEELEPMDVSLIGEADLKDHTELTNSLVCFLEQSKDTRMIEEERHQRVAVNNHKPNTKQESTKETKKELKRSFSRLPRIIPFTPTKSPSEKRINLGSERKSSTKKTPVQVKTFNAGKCTQNLFNVTPNQGRSGEVKEKTPVVSSAAKKSIAISNSFCLFSKPKETEQMQAEVSQSSFYWPIVTPMVSLEHDDKMKCEDSVEGETPRKERDVFHQFTSLDLGPDRDMDAKIQQVEESTRNLDAEIQKYLTELKDEIKPIVIPDAPTFEDVSGSTSESECDLEDEPVLSLEEKIKQHHQCSERVWKFESAAEFNWYHFSTLNGKLKFQVQCTEPNGQVIEVRTQSMLTRTSKPESLFIMKLATDRFDKSYTKPAVGDPYDILSLLDYVQMTILKLMDFLLYLKRSTVHDFQLDYDFKAQIQILHMQLRIRWQISIDFSDLDSIGVNQILVKPVFGEVNVQEILDLARGCPKGIDFLKSFVDSINSYLEAKPNRKLMK